MHSKRFGVGVAVVNRLLYAIGGFDGNDRLATMECYHPENNAWTILPPMKLGRSGAGVAALNQHIYVVGGFDGQNHLSSVERFDTDKQTWEMVADINTPRSALSLTVLDGKLYAMGGFDGQVFLTNVEVYDPAKNSWEEGTPLTSGRSGHASAVIYQPAVPSGSSVQDVVSVGHKRTNGVVDGEPMVTDDAQRSQQQMGSAVGNINVNGSGAVVLPGDSGNHGMRGNRETPRLLIGVPMSGRLNSQPSTPQQRDDAHQQQVPLNLSSPRSETPVANEVNAGNPFKYNNYNDDIPREYRYDDSNTGLVNMNILKAMWDNKTTASVSRVDTGSTGSYFKQNSGGSCSEPSNHNSSGNKNNKDNALKVIDINRLLNEPGPSSSSSSRLPTEAVAMPSTSSGIPSPPIRIAKKREADSPNIPCTPPHDGEIKIRAEENPHQPFNSVNTFLPVVDFQNQRKYRRKIVQAPNRNTDDMDADTPNQESDDDGEDIIEVDGAPVERQVPPPPPVPVAIPIVAKNFNRCHTMSKIKAAVKEKLFSPSILGSNCGSGAPVGTSRGTKRTNLVVANRRCVLGNGEGQERDEESSESDSYQMEEADGM